MDTISKQKVQATLVMEAVRKVTGRTAMVMGGAPRNWFGGRTANDIDIYYQSPADEELGPLDTVSKVLKHLSVDGVFGRLGDPLAALYDNKFETDDSYDTYNNRNVQSVVDCDMDGFMSGQNYQFIRLHVDPYVMLKQFPVNLSMCAYTENGDNIYTDDFMNGMRRKMIVATHPLKLPYQQKLCGYYPSFAFIPFDMQYLALDI